MKTAKKAKVGDGRWCRRGGTEGIEKTIDARKETRGVKYKKSKKGTVQRCKENNGVTMEIQWKKFKGKKE